MDQLQQLIKMSEALKDMSSFLKASNDQDRKNSLCEAGQFISTADLKECKWLLIELADRVATLTGVCGHIEDAISEIDVELKACEDKGYKERHYG